MENQDIVLTERTVGSNQSCTNPRSQAFSTRKYALHGDTANKSLKDIPYQFVGVRFSTLSSLRSQIQRSFTKFVTEKIANRIMNLKNIVGNKYVDESVEKWSSSLIRSGLSLFEPMSETARARTKSDDEILLNLQRTEI